MISLLRLLSTSVWLSVAALEHDPSIKVSIFGISCIPCNEYSLLHADGYLIIIDKGVYEWSMDWWH